MKGDKAECLEKIYIIKKASYQKTIVNFYKKNRIFKKNRSILYSFFKIPLL